MNNGTFGQPRPLGYPFFPQTRFVAPVHAASATTQPLMSSMRPPYVYELPNLVLNPGYVAHPPYTPSLPLRPPYTPGGGTAFVAYGYPTYGLGTSGVSTGIMRPSLAQPMRESVSAPSSAAQEGCKGVHASREQEREDDTLKRDAEETEDEDEEEIDVVGGVEDCDTNTGLTEDLKADGEDDLKNVSKVVQEDDVEDDDGASSDEERMKRDGAIEEDGKYDGSAVDNLQ